MSTKFWQLSLRGAIDVRLLVLGVAAQAATFRQAFDPPDFIGFADVDISLPQCSDGYYIAVLPGGCTVFLKLVNVTIQDGPDAGTVFTWAPPDYPAPIEAPSGSGISEVLISGGVPQGVTVEPLIPLGTGPSGDYYWLQYDFTLSFNELFVGQQDVLLDPFFGKQDVLLWTGTCYDTDANDRCTGEFQTAGDPLAATFVGPFVQIPEPATLGLLLGALGAGWLTRRRRK